MKNQPKKTCLKLNISSKLKMAKIVNKFSSNQYVLFYYVLINLKT